MSYHDHSATKAFRVCARKKGENSQIKNFKADSFGQQTVSLMGHSGFKSGPFKLGVHFYCHFG